MSHALSPCAGVHGPAVNPAAPLVHARWCTRTDLLRPAAGVCVCMWPCAPGLLDAPVFCGVGWSCMLANQGLPGQRRLGHRLHPWKPVIRCCTLLQVAARTNSRAPGNGCHFQPASTDAILGRSCCTVTLCQYVLHMPMDTRAGDSGHRDVRRALPGAERRRGGPREQAGGLWRARGQGAGHQVRLRVSRELRYAYGSCIRF